MRLTKETIKALELDETQIALLDTPFKDMTKEGVQAAFNLADKIYAFQEQKKAEDKSKEKDKTEEERIHAGKSNMIKLKRNFN